MTSAAELVSYGTLVTCTVGLLGLLVRTSMSHSRAMTRLDNLDEWQRNRSVDRSEFVDLSKRVDCTEADAVKASEGVNELRVQFAAIPGELRSIRDLMERDGRDTRHDISGLRMGLEKLADLIRSAPKQ